MVCLAFGLAIPIRGLIARRYASALTVPRLDDLDNLSSAPAMAGGYPVPPGYTPPSARPAPVAPAAPMRDNAVIAAVVAGAAQAPTGPVLVDTAHTLNAMPTGVPTTPSERQTSDTGDDDKVRRRPRFGRES